MSGAALRLRDIACLRGGRMLFAGLSLHLSPGESALVAGPNGIGKSSLLRLVAGLLQPYAGTIERSGSIALTDEAIALDRERPLADALAFWARLDGASRPRIDAVLADLNIPHLADVPVRMLSTGQRKRAALARTIVSGADIWLLDEPANGLDLASAETLGRIVDAHRAAGGIVLGASHLPLCWRHDREFTIAAPDEDELAGDAP